MSEILEPPAFLDKRREIVVPETGEIVDRDAAEIGELYERARSSIVDSVRHQIECGLRLAVKKESLKHGEWMRWLQINTNVLGFGSDRTAQRLIKLSEEANPTLASDLDEFQAAQLSRRTWGHEKEASQLVQQSTSNEHYTPAQYIGAARKVLREIDLDPASCEKANETVKAKTYFSADADGLQQKWKGRVWLNPPYGRLVGDFIAKLSSEYAAGNVTAAIALVNAHCTDTAWFQSLWGGLLCFTNHRINFYGDDTRSGSTHGSVFVYFGPDSAMFIKQFRQFGAIVQRVDNDDS